MLGYMHGPDPFLRTFLTRTRGPHPTRTLRVLHWGFTDFAVLSPELQNAAPPLGQAAEAMAPSGTVTSPSAGRDAIRAERSFIARFFSRYLR
jgi:hypothetical protein